MTRGGALATVWVPLHKEPQAGQNGQPGNGLGQPVVVPVTKACPKDRQALQGCRPHLRRCAALRIAIYGVSCD